MSQKDLLRELKSTIKELTDEKDDLLTKLKSKESRIKQVLIQLEQSVDDVAHCGKKILGWGINFHHIRCYFLKWKEPKQ